MRFKILAAAVLVSTVGASATTASAAHHKVAVGHRHSTPALVVAQASNSPSAVAMPLPLKPVAARPKSASAQSKGGAAPRTASGAARTGGAPAATGTGGRADRSGGRAASF
jgi:hypothetical protein